MEVEIMIIEKENHKKILQQVHGEKIRSIRKQEGLTQEKLAELLEIDTKTLSRIENGDSILSSDAAIRLYLEFGYSPDWIYGISQIPKDDDKLYLVDIRDILQIENEHVNIKIKKYLFDLLARTSENAGMNELKVDEDTIALNKGIEKQKRLFIYSHNKKEFYRAHISTEQFTVETESKQ